MEPLDEYLKNEYFEDNQEDRQEDDPEGFKKEYILQGEFNHDTRTEENSR